GLVAGPDLAQVDACARQPGQVTHEGAEVDPLFGREINRRLAPVPLPFGMRDLHRQRVLAYAVAHRTADLFFVGTEIGRDLPIVGGRQADNVPNRWKVVPLLRLRSGRGLSPPARATASALLLRHFTQRRNDPEVLPAFDLHDDGSVDAWRRGVSLRLGEILARVRFDSDFDG